MKNTKTERIIAEQGDEGWLVMWKDGSVQWYPTQKAVITACRSRLGSAAMLVSEIEWRYAR